MSASNRNELVEEIPKKNVVRRRGHVVASKTRTSSGAGLQAWNIMDPNEYDPQCSQLPSYFPDSRLGAMFDHVDTSDAPLADENPILDWNTLGGYYYYPSSGVSDIEQANYLAADTFQTPEELLPPQIGPVHDALRPPDISSQTELDLPTLAQDSHLAQRGYTNLQQWMEGTYRPPVPCSYCRKHRLQCLTIRTTSANPNPVTSCSSCVALFRECSLSRGEKREPSRFETLSPVMGHLHGVTEHPEDGVSDVALDT